MLISFVLCTLAVPAQSAKKKIPDGVFVPKGQWITGFSFAFSEHEENDYQFLIVNKLNSDGYSFKVSPMVSYAVKNNLTLGGRFTYNRSLTKFSGLDFNLGDLELGLEDTNQLTHSYMVMGIMRNYINLGSSKRFALFAETQVKFGGGKTRLVNGAEETLKGTFANHMEFGIGLTPGIVAFVNNFTAVEVSIGVLGIDFSKTNYKEGQIYTGKSTSSAANFKINLFSIGLGLAFYI